VKGLTIALIHNLKPVAKPADLPADYYSECDSQKTVNSIAMALRKGGHTVLPVEGDQRLPEWFKENAVDLAFNIAEGFHGEAREARIPALLELLDIPHTGSGVLALALAMNKAKSKQMFKMAGVPTPNFQLFGHPNDPMDKRLHFPLIVKPNCEGSAKGIWASSVVRDEVALRTQVERVFKAYAQEVLVEEYIDGVELTVGILGTDQVLPVLEIDFTDCVPSGEFFYSWRMKEFQGNKKLHLTPRFWCPARLNPQGAQAVQAVALKSAKALGVRDVARVDIRLSLDGIPYVLEVNPLPGLDPEESNLPLMAQAAGMSYEALIHRMVGLAMERSVQRYRSFHPLSHVTSPKPQTPRRRVLPDSKEKATGSPGHPAVAPRALRPVGPALRRKEARKDDFKEEDLGR